MPLRQFSQIARSPPADQMVEGFFALPVLFCRDPKLPQQIGHGFRRNSASRLCESRIPFGKMAARDDIIERNEPAIYSGRATVETNRRDRVVSAGVGATTDANGSLKRMGDVTEPRLDRRCQSP